MLLLLIHWPLWQISTSSLSLNLSPPQQRHRLLLIDIGMIRGPITVSKTPRYTFQRGLWVIFKLSWNRLDVISIIDWSIDIYLLCQYVSSWQYKCIYFGNSLLSLENASYNVGHVAASNCHGTTPDGKTQLYTAAPSSNDQGQYTMHHVKFY